MYKVLYSSQLHWLEESVNAFIKDGYIPVGGPFLTVNGSYAQAVWRVK